ncbi:MAG: hypothetical protein MK226_09525 [Saprospiraceae bacterium]|jgi:hypothetical protein|nr:hypothetical protein [Saprospiraceae bacterium]
MKLQQSSWPFMLLFGFILLGIPLTEYFMEKKEASEAIVIEVKSDVVNIAALEDS